MARGNPRWRDNIDDPRQGQHLSKFDIAAAVGVMCGAPQTLHMKQSDVQTTYLIIEPGADPTAPGALSLSLYVSSDYGGGSIVFAGDGTPKRLDLPT
jgi:hypothetical protein